jgi:hypothetical protein
MASFYDQPHWIAALSEKERKRRAAIATFNAHAPAFIDLLAAALGSDSKIYEKEFPDAQVFIEKGPPGSGTITITCSGYEPKTSATIQLHSDGQKLSCDYRTDPTQHRAWQETLEASQLGLSFQGRGPEYCAKELSEKILKPILFPAL